MTKTMLIDSANREEVRVCVLENGRVEDFDFESASRRPLRGNIYLARVTRVEPSLQAAFVEYGGNRHGFLAFGEIHPDYYQIPISDRRAIAEAEAEEAALAELLNIDQSGDDEGGDEGLDDFAATEDASDPGTDEKSDAKPARRRRSRRRGRSATHEAREAQTEVEPGEQSASSSPIDAQDDPDEDDDGDDTMQAGGPAHDAMAGDDAGPHDQDEADAEAEGPEGEEDPGFIAALSIPRTEISVSAEPSEIDLDDAEALTADDAADFDAADFDEAHDFVETLDGSDRPSPDADELDADELDADEPGADDQRTEGSGTEDPDSDDDDFAAPTGESRAALMERYKAARRNRQQLLRNYKIQEVIKRRQILLVQVVKEERGNKGAALTTFMSLAGRYCVLMPNTARGGGISRKIPNASDRKRLRRVVDSLEVPKGMGLIIRTAGAKRTKAEVKRDYEYLIRLWESIRTLTLQSIAPCLIYEEANLIKRAIRDLYDKDIDRILVEGEAGYREAKTFMKMLMPSHAKNVQHYKEGTPLFLANDVELQLDAMYQPVVRLKSGGYIVINQTEALVAIDVNSGKATRERNIEQTAFRTNLEAAREIARQCRLRDLAGLLVIDFIDMEEGRNNRAVEKCFKDALRDDRARIQIGRISNFGLLEMSRQRRRSGIVDGTTHSCPACNGAGVVRSNETAALRILRSVEADALAGKAGHLAVKTSVNVALFILNHKRAWLNRVEAQYGVSIEITADPGKSGDAFEIERTGAPRNDVATPAFVRADLTEDPDVDAPESAADEDDDEAAASEGAPAPSDDGEDRNKRRRRRRRRGRRSDGSEATGDDTGEASAHEAAAVSDEDDSDDDEPDTDDADARTNAAQGARKSVDDADADPDSDAARKRRRRGRRGGRRNRRRDGEPLNGADAAAPEMFGEEPQPSPPLEDDREGARVEIGSSVDGDHQETAEPARFTETALAQTPLIDTADISSEDEVMSVADEPPAAPPAEVASGNGAADNAPTAPEAKPASRKGWWQRALGA